MNTNASQGRDLYLYDRVTGTGRLLLSVPAGRSKLAFTSSASDLTAHDTNNATDIFETTSRG